MRKPLQNITNIKSRNKLRTDKPNKDDDNEHNKENVRPTNHNRRPLATILDEKTNMRTRKLPDEVMSHYILDFYEQPLVNGKIQQIKQYLVKNNIQQNENAFRRNWKNSKLLEMKINGEASGNAKVVYADFLKTEKEEKKRRNTRNKREWDNRGVESIDKNREIEVIALSSEGKI